MKHLLLLLALLGLTHLGAQGALISPEEGTPDEDAILELRSSNQGFLPPRLSRQQRGGILNPPNGLIIYNTSSNRLNIYDGEAGEWVELNPIPENESTVTPEQTLTLSSGHFHARQSSNEFDAAVGQGGANIQAGVGALVAAVPIPVGSTITSITFYYRDETSNAELNLSLTREFLDFGSFNTIINFTTGVVNASPSWTDSGAISLNHVVSSNAGYTLTAYSTNWSNDLHIKGAVINYTLPTN